MEVDQQRRHVEGFLGLAALEVGDRQAALQTQADILLLMHGVVCAGGGSAGPLEKRRDHVRQPHAITAQPAQLGGGLDLDLGEERRKRLDGLLRISGPHADLSMGEGGILACAATRQACVFPLA